MSAFPLLTRRLLAGLAGSLVTVAAWGFPPAPDHVIFGVVRDEQGVPLTRPNAEVWLEASDRVLAKSVIGSGPGPGLNYRLAIPMDSGVTGDLYTPSALRPTVPFRLRVRVGGQTFLPIEMTGAAKFAATPGASTRIDLTLGVDSDGDGLPDAWEQQLIAALGGGKTLADINPGDDADRDGSSNLHEYLAGTYAFDPAEGFDLAIVSAQEERPVLEFLAVRGRSYSIRSSEDLTHWVPVRFTLTTDAPGAALRTSFEATDTRIRRPVIAPDAATSGARFFRLYVN